MNEHMYGGDERCVCGGLVVWFDDPPIGNGCEVEGKPWAKEVRLRDPEERAYDRRCESIGMIWDEGRLKYVTEKS